MRDEASTVLMRSELCDRLAAMRALAGAGAAREFAESVRAVRRLACAYGLIPVARLAEALERVGDGHDCATALYLERLYDAIGCDADDEQASQAMLASISLQLRT